MAKKSSVPPQRPDPPPPSPAPAPTPVAVRHLFTRQEWIAAALAFLVSGLTYFYFMTPEVTLEDSGELVTGAFNFGVPHPTGYPFWAFLGWMWRHLVPFGNPAWRLCLFSVVTGAVLVGIMTLMMSRSIVMLLRNSPWGEALEERHKEWLGLAVATAAAMMYAFDRGVWQWACVPEMRALNAFSWVAATCIFFAWMMRPEQHRYLYALLLVWGLSLANHQTIIVMAAPFMIGMWVVGYLAENQANKQRYSGLMEFGFALLVTWAAGVLVNAWLVTGPEASVWTQKVKTVLLFGPLSEPMPVILLVGGSAAALLVFGVQSGRMSGKRAAWCAGLFIVALSMYAYMPIAASTNPPMNWGYCYTKQGFLHAITRGQYEQIRLSLPWGENTKFWIQMGLFVRGLLTQYGWPVGLFALAPFAALFAGWQQLKPRARQWLIYALSTFLISWIGLIIIINPDIDKQNQEINLKFFAPAHGFFAMLIGYGLALSIAFILSRAKNLRRTPVCLGSWLLVLLAIIPLKTNWKSCDQRGHDFGYQFGYRMFYPGGEYPPMERDAVLYGGTDPGRFVPTYMIFCESRVAPRDRFRDPNFDRRDVYIITQNALADTTYMSYVRDHYDYSRPDPTNPATLARRLPWQQALFKWGWHRLYRDSMYPKEPIWVPSEQDTQHAFQEYVGEVQARIARGEHLSPDEQVSIEGGAVQVRGVAGVMKINGILTRWIFEHNRDKHPFYVEESYVIEWMYPYLTPAGIIMKINHDVLPTPQQSPDVWKEIMRRDRAYWDQLCAEFSARPEFRRDTDAQKTFSKLRSAIGGVYAYRHLTEEATYAYRQARQLCPESPEANFRLAQLYMELGRVDDALALMQDFQKLDPLNSKIGDAIRQIAGMKQAPVDIANLEAAHAKSPLDFGVVMQLAQVYGRAGQMDRVVTVFQSYAAQKEASADSILQIAQIYLSNGRINEAVNDLQLMTQRFPQDPRGFYGLAVVFTAQQHAADALAMLEKSIAINPGIRAQAATDQQFNPLHANPRFQQLVSAP
jgi:tetratricopeptide (TPR) repeat protein